MEDLSRLVRASQAGDCQAREHLVRTVQSYVYFYCRTMLENDDEAWDAAQDILMTMLGSLGSLHNPEAFYCWLRQIVFRICRKRAKRVRRIRRRRLAAEARTLSFDQIEPDAQLDREEVRRAVQELVQALPPKQQICILLYYYEEMSVEEIAAELKVPAGTVKSRLHYARLAIKDGAEKYADEGFPLYGVSPLPFLRYFLQQEAALGAEAAAKLAQAVLAGGSAAGPVLAVLTGKGAAVLAGLALAGAVAGGVLYRTAQPVRTPPPVQPPLQTVQPAERPKPPEASQQDPEVPVSPAPESAGIPAAEPKPVSQTVHTEPHVQPENEPELSEGPVLPEEPLLELPLPSTDLDVPPPEPVLLLTPDLDSEPEIMEPSPKPDFDLPLDWPRPIVPTPSQPEGTPPEEPTPEGPTPEEPTPEEPGPEEPPPEEPTPEEPTPEEPAPEEPTPEDPPPEEPEVPVTPPVQPEEPVQPTVHEHTFTDSGGNGGYGYSATLSEAWGGRLPSGTLTYSSSDPKIVAVNDKGVFTTLAPGDAVVTAVDPDDPADRYELAIHVEDCFRWTFYLPDVTLQKGQADTCVITTYQFSKLEDYDIRVEQVKWSSSDPSVVRLLDTGSPISCVLCAASPGTATVTGTVTFQLDTADGEMTMQDDVSFQVEITAPPPRPVLPEPGPEPEKPTPEEPRPEKPGPEEPEPENPEPENPKPEEPGPEGPEPENPRPEEPGPEEPEPENPRPEEPGPEEPEPENPEPEEPGPEGPSPDEPTVYRKEMTSFGLNSGYGYRSTFAEAWIDALPEGLTYSSSDEAVVKVHETTGAFYTVSGGTADLTAEGPGVQYILTIQVQDCFQWTYTVSDLELGFQETKTHGLSDYTLPDEVWILGGKWSSTGRCISFMDRTWQSCDMMGMFSGTSTVTCVVHFDLMTFEGYVRMETEFSFQVTVLQPEPTPSPDSGPVVE